MRNAMGVGQRSSAVHTHLMPKCLLRRAVHCTSGKLHAAEDTSLSHHVDVVRYVKTRDEQF